LRPVPVGAIGELHIGGHGLARGYLNRPELTAQKFIRNPFRDEPGARIYKTGDRARYLPDGTIECLGRSDEQIKIRGFRIEPGEIESVLRRHPSISEVVVTAREDIPGERRLVAYMVRRPDGHLNHAELRALLRESLAEYMLPSTFVELTAVPLTPNGKINRRALPAPDYDAQVSESYIAPRKQIEELLAEIWAEVLQLSRVGIDDNFFEVGGHSLLAMRIVSRLRNALRIEIPLHSLFESPTIAGLAEAIERQQAVAPVSQITAAAAPGGSAQVEELTDEEVNDMLSEMLVQRHAGL
jgi:acyl carrier protein